MYLFIIEQPHSACLSVLGYYRATSQCLSQCTLLLQSNLRVSVSKYLVIIEPHSVSLSVLGIVEQPHSVCLSVVIIEQPHSVCRNVLGYYRATSQCLSQCTCLL